MRKLTEVLRLTASGLSNREIARGCNAARSTISDYLKRAKAAGVVWPLPEGMDEEKLEGLLFGQPKSRGRDMERPVPDWGTVHKELRRKGVTLPDCFGPTAD